LKIINSSYRINSFGDYKMNLGKFPDSILLIGTDIGPFAQKIKEFNNKIKIGAVDLLGNIETRKFADWKFSVLKQEEECHLNRNFHRTVVEYLFELALVMLEEREFDHLIPLTPFNKYPELVKKLSTEVAIPLFNTESITTTCSKWNFVLNFLQLHPTYQKYYSLDSFTNDKNNHSINIINPKFQFTDFNSNQNTLNSIKDRSNNLFVSTGEIHCGSFYSSINSIKFLGFNTLGEPFNHKFIFDDLELNSYLPFSQSNHNLEIKIFSLLKQIISSLKLMGMLTIYFLLLNGNIIPIACNSLPDINIDLWISRSGENLVPLLLNPSLKGLKFNKETKFGYKCPYYSNLVQQVPKIPSWLATNRNLPGVLSNPNYPIFSMHGFSKSRSKLHKKLGENTTQIKQYFPVGNL
jgi:hypothetical protein